MEESLLAKVTKELSKGIKPVLKIYWLAHGIILKETVCLNKIKGAVGSITGKASKNLSLNTSGSSAFSMISSMAIYGWSYWSSSLAFDVKVRDILYIWGIFIFYGKSYTSEASKTSSLTFFFRNPLSKILGGFERKISLH